VTTRVRSPGLEVLKRVPSSKRFELTEPVSHSCSGIDLYKGDAAPSVKRLGVAGSRWHSIPKRTGKAPAKRDFRVKMGDATKSAVFEGRDLEVRFLK
jgi:hypothetical protein